MPTTTKTHFKRPRLVRTPKWGRYPSQEDRQVMSCLCPDCAQDCDDVYKNSLGQVFGCNQCVTVMSVHDYMVQQLENAGKDISDEDLLVMSSLCPCCDRDCESVYIDDHGLAHGCNLCVTVLSIHRYRRQLLNRGGGSSD